MNFSDTKGKSLRRGGNPSNVKDWEVCSGDPKCPRHYHDYKTVKPTELMLDEALFENVKADLTIPPLPDGYFFKISWDGGYTPTMSLRKKTMLGLSKKVASRNMPLYNKKGFNADYCLDAISSANFHMAELFNENLGSIYGNIETQPVQPFNKDGYFQQGGSFESDQILEHYRTIMHVLDKQ